MKQSRSFRVHERGMLMRVAGELAKMIVSEEKPLLVEVSPYSEKRTSAQNRYLHAILRDVAENVMVGGRYFDEDAWKEHFRRKFIGTEEIDLPTGERIERGISTTTLDVGQMAQAIDNFLGELSRDHGYLVDQAA